MIDSDSDDMLKAMVMLHELGHYKMLRLLRRPHGRLVYDPHRNPAAYMKYLPRNVLDRFLVQISGLTYPVLFLVTRLDKSELKENALGLLKLYIRVALKGVIHRRA